MKLWPELGDCQYGANWRTGSSVGAPGIISGVFYSEKDKFFSPGPNIFYYIPPPSPIVFGPRKGGKWKYQCYQ